MKCLILGFLFLEIAAGLTLVSPSGHAVNPLTVLGNLFFGKELKDYPKCGRPKSGDGVGRSRKVFSRTTGPAVVLGVFNMPNPHQYDILLIAISIFIN